MIYETAWLPGGKKKKKVKINKKVFVFPLFLFLPYLYLTPLSHPPCGPSALLCVSLTWYLTSQMVQRQTHSSLHPLLNGTDSYAPSPHKDTLGVWLPSPPTRNTSARKRGQEECAWLCEKHLTRTSDRH